MLLLLSSPNHLKISFLSKIFKAGKQEVEWAKIWWVVWMIYTSKLQILQNIQGLVSLANTLSCNKRTSFHSLPWILSSNSSLNQHNKLKQNSALKVWPLEDNQSLKYLPYPKKQWLRYFLLTLGFRMSSAMENLSAASAQIVV